MQSKIKQQFIVVRSNNQKSQWKDVALERATNMLWTGELAYKFIKSKVKRKTFRSLNALEINDSEALEFVFTPGHPRYDTLYIKHPIIPKVYYTAASFHRMVFEHKFAEAINLLMHLGATEIRVEHVRGWSRKFDAFGDIPIEGVIGEVKSGFFSKGSESLLFEATLEGNVKPSLPESRVWYSHEPTWQTIALGRISHGLGEFSLAVNYEEDFGVNAKLKIKANTCELGLGGDFNDHEVTTWVISGKFLKT